MSCIFSPGESIEPQNSSNFETSTKEDEIRRATVLDGIKSSLNSFDDRCFSFQSGWFAYTFCYNKFVKQFHPLISNKVSDLSLPKEDPSIPNYYLGVSPRFFPHESNVDEKITNPEILLSDDKDIRYAYQIYKFGTVCDLTGREREVKVKYICNPHIMDRITSVKENTICFYTLEIESMRFCGDNHLNYFDEDYDVLPINCTFSGNTSVIDLGESPITQLKQDAEIFQVLSAGPADHSNPLFEKFQKLLQDEQNNREKLQNSFILGRKIERLISEKMIKLSNESKGYIKQGDLPNSYEMYLEDPKESESAKMVFLIKDGNVEILEVTNQDKAGGFENFLKRFMKGDTEEDESKNKD